MEINLNKEICVFQFMKKEEKINVWASLAWRMKNNICCFWTKNLKYNVKMSTCHLNSLTNIGSIYKEKVLILPYWTLHLKKLVNICISLVSIRIPYKGYRFIDTTWFYICWTFSMWQKNEEQKFWQHQGSNRTIK